MSAPRRELRPLAKARTQVRKSPAKPFPREGGDPSSPLASHNETWVPAFAGNGRVGRRFAFRLRLVPRCDRRKSLLGRGDGTRFNTFSCRINRSTAGKTLATARLSSYICPKRRASAGVFTSVLGKHYRPRQNPRICRRAFQAIGHQILSSSDPPL